MWLILNSGFTAVVPKVQEIVDPAFGYLFASMLAGSKLFPYEHSSKGVSQMLLVAGS